mmetsp:Transcript_14726/g.48293  ORF Transcript_14726/g.48293 Transcript_14726/m.48293 type:complete len:682 (-) Transcript_14726:864-2909(-)
MRFSSGCTLCACVAWLSVGMASGAFLQTGSLQISFPSELRGTYNMSLGNFGVPLYGAQLRSEVVLPAASQHNGFGCEEFTDGYSVEQAGTPITMMLRRGGDPPCKFVRKVLHAQRANASAVLIADSVQEGLFTMDKSTDAESVQALHEINIPAALIQKDLGDRIEQALSENKPVVAVMDWSNIVPHPDERVEWEFWTNSNDNCEDCEEQKAFIRSFAPVAKELESAGYTQFTPHYLLWICPEQYRDSEECRSQCANHGKYCFPDPESDLENGYTGREVVIENLRQLCFFREANATGQPWLWWDYVTKFGEQCTMEQQTYDEQCATRILNSLGFIGEKLQHIRDCVGDAEDYENPLLKLELDSQSHNTKHGDIVFLPTLIANNVQYRGNMDRSAILRFLCNAFSKGDEPPVCAQEDLIEQECAIEHPGFETCHKDPQGKTACKPKNSSPYFTCECPEGTNLVADQHGQGYCEDINECLSTAKGVSSCNCDRCVCYNLPGGEASPGYQCFDTGPSSCANGRSCWHDGPFSACQDNIDLRRQKGIDGIDPRTVVDHVCACPDGFTGDGYSCEDVDECETKCKGKHMKCENLPGNYTCTCSKGYVSGPEGGCVREPGAGSEGGTLPVAIICSVIVALILVAAGSYALYKYRLRSFMDQEIRAIMKEYMPLDKEDEDAGDPENAQL